MSDNIKVNQCTVRLIIDDLTALNVEAFVFYARSDLTLGAGFGNAISMRGGPTIREELERIGFAEASETVITAAGELKAKYIIHAVGPAFQEEDAENKLRITMENVLKCADENGISQLAFPAMGTGFYCIPLGSCSKVMIESIKKYLSGKTGLSEIIICANDNREYRAFVTALASES